MSHVLVVDDDEGIRETIRLVLEDADHHVMEVNDGEQALQLLHESAVPLVVLLDLVMPKVNGIQFLNTVNADSHLKALHSIVLMTANCANILQEVGPLLQEMHVEVITKPFDIDRLLEAVERVSHHQM
jgi:two-component system chemotaxis response regulator CheY